jgi:uncharacterized membrane protein
MVVPHDGAVVPYPPNPPRVARPTHDHHLIWGIVQLLLLVGVLVAVVVAVAAGQQTTAIIIGLLAGAFIAGRAV